MKNNKQELYIDFAGCLRKVCKDKKLFDWGLDYFKNLQNIDYKITKSHFEKIKLNNKILRQDCLDEVFKNKNYVSVDEFFLYQFKKNINTIKYVDKIDDKEPGVHGRFNCDSKFILVKKINLHKFEGKYLFYPSASKPQFEDTEEMQNKFNLITEKFIYYHELTHLFQPKNFNKSSIYKYGMTNFLYNRNNDDKMLVSVCDNLYIDALVAQGSQFLTEISNQYFLDNLTNKLAIEKNIKSVNKGLNKNFEEKYTYTSKEDNYLDNICSYYNNGGLFIPYLTALYDDINPYDFNLKNGMYANRLNKLTCSNYIKEKVVQHFVENIVNDSVTLEIINDENESLQNATSTFYNAIKNLSNSSIVNLFLFERFTHSPEHLFYKNKDFFQTFALNLYRNKINNEFKNNNIPKDSKYFNKVNQNLTEMERFLYGKWKDKVHYRNLETGKKCTSSLADVGSIEVLADSYPDVLSFQEFDMLLLDINKFVKTLPKSQQNNAINTLTFLKKQKKLNEKVFILKELPTTNLKFVEKPSNITEKSEKEL